MKHKTWFRLVIRAIGILLIGLSLPALCQGIGFIVYLFMESSGMPQSYTWIQTAYYGGGIAQASLGIYLIFGGTWIVDTCIPSNRPYCPDCGYDLSHSVTSTMCPECGVSLPTLSPAPQQPRSDAP